MPRFGHLLLTAALLFSYVVGPCLSAEIVHTHDGPEGHLHVQTGFQGTAAHYHGHEHHHGHHHGHGHGHHDGQDPHPSPDSDDGTGDSEPAPHSHHVCLVLDWHVAPSTGISADLADRPETDFHRLLAEQCPEGPFFELIKPPQLG